MAAKQFAVPAPVAFNSNGFAVAGAVARLYESGTVTPANFYSDSGLTTPLGASITADGAGRFLPLPYQDEATAFRLVIEDADGVELIDQDPYYFGSPIYGLITVTSGSAVASRALLAVVSSPAANQSAILTEAGREGSFVFDDSDLSAEVAADTEQGVYVAPDSDPTGASGAWVRKFSGPMSATWFGTVADGSTDDQPALQAALDLAETVGAARRVRIPAGSYSVAVGLSVPDGVEVEGDGPDTLIAAANSTHPSAFKVTGNSDFAIRNLTARPFSTGTNRFAVYLDTCARAVVENVATSGQTDGGGIWMIDCDHCQARGCYFDGGASMNSYAVYFAGCKYCVAIGCRAYRPDFGFVIVGQDIQPLCTRTTAETFGNAVIGCHVSNHGGHAFDINSAVGNIISGCSAEDYAGVSTHIAFQSKDSASTAATRNNIFIGCTAKDVPSGFGGQSSSNAVFVGCTAINVSNYGFFLNGCVRFSIIGARIYECTLGGIHLNLTCTNNVFNDVLIETSTATAKGINMLTSGGNNGNNFDNITTTSTLAKFIDIGTSNGNNRFGWGCRSNGNSITDATNTNIWPLVTRTELMDLTSAGQVKHGEYLHRGMHVASVRFVITTSITGSPTVQGGTIGSNAAIATAQAVTGSAGASVLLTRDTSELFNTASIAQGRVSATGSAGAGFLQFEGLPRL